MRLLFLLEEEEKTDVNVDRSAMVSGITAIQRESTEICGSKQESYNNSNY